MEILTINDSSLLTTSSAFKLKWLCSYPVKYGIQLVTGSRLEHSAMYLNGQIREKRWGGIITTPFDQWLRDLPIFCDVYLYKLKIVLSDDQIQKLEEFFEARKDIKFSLWPYIFAKIPILNRIKFVKTYCTSEYIMALQCADVLPFTINPYSYDPDTLIDLLTDYNLIGGREVIR